MVLSDQKAKHIQILLYQANKAAVLQPNFEVGEFPF